MKKTDDIAFMTLVRDRYDAGIDADRDNRDRDHQDRLFFTGGENQWAEGVPQERRAQGRPCESFNRLPQFVKQVSGEIRQNKPAIKVMPVDGQTDPDMADIYTAIIRHIESASDAHRVYAGETEKAVIGGAGWWRVKSHYCSDAGFDQDLGIEGIPSPNSVVCDPDARHPTRSDMKYCFVTEMVSKARFEREYPDHAQADFGTREGWVQGNFVRIAEYWEKREVRKEKVYAVQLPEGGIENQSESAIREMTGVDKDVPVDELLKVMGVEVKSTRSVPIYEVRSRLVSGNAPLGDWQEWPGRFIPLVRVVGEEVAAGDRIFRHGLIHHAKPSQTGYNYARNAMLERHAQSTRAPWLVTAAMVAGASIKGMWENLNKGNPPVLIYDADPKVPAGPKRVDPPQIDAAAYQESMVASEDMKATTGIYDAALGAKSNETSGIAIARRDAQGDTATYVYIDNMEAAITHTGRILIDLIPHYYDDSRIIRMIGEDGEIEKFVELNQTLPDGKRWNDVTRGKYDVIVATGPAYATKREEASQKLLDLTKAFPQLAEIGGDIVIRALDIPLGDKLADRIAKSIPEGLDEELDRKREEEQEGKPQQPPQPSPEEMAMQAEMQMQQAKLEGEQQAAQQKIQLASAEASAKIEMMRAEQQAKMELAREEFEFQKWLATEKAELEREIATHNAVIKESSAAHHAMLSEKKITTQRPGGDVSK